MDETAGLMRAAEHELASINEELDLQTEKFVGIQEKVGMHRRNLYENDTALGKLKSALKIRKFVILILVVAIVFSVLFFMIKTVYL